MPAQPEKSEKEILNDLLAKEESFPVIAETEPKIDKEVESYIEKVEKEIYLSQPVTDDSGQPLISDPAPQEPTIVLPITETAYTQGLGQKVTESIRWLSAWCGRIIKIFGARAKFRQGEAKV
jgi:hypothetical protein